jgi:hypothetical protein
VVENHGSLIAGSSTAPIGLNGVVTIHLWGAKGDSGATCKSDNECGVPDPIWSSNPAPSMINPVLNPASCNPTSVLPGNVTNECFYAYDILDDADMAPKRNAYFGHKVLALSYGGTLQLFGRKGATYCASFPCPDKDPALSPSNTGTSWLRLNGSLKPGATSLTVTGAVDWQDGDHIVVTTTDYLPGWSAPTPLRSPSPMPTA